MIAAVSAARPTTMEIECAGFNAAMFSMQHAGIVITQQSSMPICLAPIAGVEET